MKSINIRNPLISICIPTYNRPQMIYGQIEDILNFIKESGLQEDFEVIVIDNNSSHDIYKILEKYLTNPCLKVFRNKSNLGMAGNIVETIKKCTGYYYYFIGDDNRINWSGFGKIYHLLKFNGRAVYIGFIKCFSNEDFFTRIFNSEKLKNSSPLDDIPFYYIGNACAFVPSDLCKEFVLKHQSLALSLPIPQAFCVLYSLMKGEPLVKENVPVLREVADDDFVNSIQSGWSIFYTLITIPVLAMRKFSNEFNIPLSKKFFYYRHPELRMCYLIQLMKMIFLRYYFLDSIKDREKLRSELINSSYLPFFNKFILVFFSKELFVKIFNLLLKLPVLMWFSIGIELKKKIEKNKKFLEEAKFNKSKHLWGDGVF